MTVKFEPIGEVTTYISSGISRPLFEDTEGVPVLRSNNVKDGEINTNELKFWHRKDPYGANLETVKPRNEDILVNFVNGSASELGKAGIYRGVPNDCIVSTNLFIVRFNKKKVSVEYAKYFFQSSFYKKWLYVISGFTGQGSFNKSEFCRLLFPLRSIPEQTQIADLLTTWDTAIEKTERLIAAKEKSFQILTLGLFEQNSGKWHQFLLRDICEAITRKNTVGEVNVLTISAQHGLVSQLEYYNKSVSAEDVSGYYLVKQGEFAYNRSSSGGYPYGAIKRLDASSQGVVSTLYLCFAIKPKAPCDSDFLAHAFEAGVLNRQLSSVCQEGARSHGLLNITKTDFFDLQISLPTLILLW